MNQEELDKKFLREAIRLAQESMQSGQGGPFGAVIVKDNSILASGSNAVTSENDPTAHAEVVAIRRACKALGHFQLDDCVLYTSCEPCPMCLGAIYWARPKRIVYACTRQDAADIDFDDAFIYEEIAETLEKRKIPMQGLLREEGQRVFQAWTNKQDKTLY